MLGDGGAETITAAQAAIHKTAQSLLGDLDDRTGAGWLTGGPCRGSLDGARGTALRGPAREPVRLCLGLPGPEAVEPASAASR